MRVAAHGRGAVSHSCAPRTDDGVLLLALRRTSRSRACGRRPFSNRPHATTSNTRQARREVREQRVGNTLPWGTLGRSSPCARQRGASAGQTPPWRSHRRLRHSNSSARESAHGTAVCAAHSGLCLCTHLARALSPSLRGTAAVCECGRGERCCRPFLPDHNAAGITTPQHYQ